MSNTGHNDPPRSESGFAPAGADDDLYAEHAIKLRRFVGGRVVTSDANLDDACGFAWMQLVEVRPSRGASIFFWLARRDQGGLAPAPARAPRRPRR